MSGWSCVVCLPFCHAFPPLRIGRTCFVLFDPQISDLLLMPIPWTSDLSPAKTFLRPLAHGVSSSGSDRVLDIRKECFFLKSGIPGWVNSSLTWSSFLPLFFFFFSYGVRMASVPRLFLPGGRRVVVCGKMLVNMFSTTGPVIPLGRLSIIPGFPFQRSSSHLPS